MYKAAALNTRVVNVLSLITLYQAELYSELFLTCDPRATHWLAEIYTLLRAQPWLLPLSLDC